MTAYEGPCRVSTPDMESLGTATLSGYEPDGSGWTGRVTFDEADGAAGVVEGLKLRLLDAEGTPVVLVTGREWTGEELVVASDLPLPGAAAYEGAVTLTMTSGDSFATAVLVASPTPSDETATWKGLLHSILFRTQMVPVPLNPTEHLRLDDAEGTPSFDIHPLAEFAGCAVVEAHEGELP